MNKKLLIIGLCMAISFTGSHFAAQPSAKTIKKQQPKPSAPISGIDGQDQAAQLLKEIEELSGDEKQRATGRYLKLLGYKKLGGEYLEYGLGGLEARKTYTLGQLKQLKCCRLEIVDLGGIQESDDTAYDFKHALELIMRMGHQEATFKDTIDKDKEIGAAMLAQQEKDRRDAEQRAIDRAHDLDMIKKRASSQQEVDNNRFKNLYKLIAESEIAMQLLKIIAAVGSLIIALMVLNHVLKSRYMRKPELILATNIRFKWFQKSNKIEESSMIHSKKRRGKIAKLLSRIKMHAKNPNIGLPNLILEGPPGVGKTATAMAIMKESGCLYAKIDGSKLLQWTTHQAVEEANKLIAILKAQNKPTYLIIDEGDILFSKRNKDKEVDRVLAPFLSQFALTKGPVGLIILTNLYDQLDTAAVNRVSPRYIWTFEPPTPAECTNIAVKYLSLEAKKLGLAHEIAFNSRRVRRKIYTAIEDCKDELVGRTIEAIAQQAAVEGYKGLKKGRFNLPNGRTSNGTLELETFLKLLKKDE